MSVLVAASVAAAVLAGCVLGEGRAEDTMTIANRTSEPITVTYEAVTNGQVFSQAVIELDPGESSYVSPQLFGSDQCLRGAFVARSDGEVVDRLPLPCKKQVWEVTEE